MLDAAPATAFRVNGDPVRIRRGYLDRLQRLVPARVAHDHGLGAHAAKVPALAVVGEHAHSRGRIRHGAQLCELAALKSTGHGTNRTNFAPPGFAT